MPKINTRAALAAFLVLGALGAGAALLPFLPSPEPAPQRVYAEATALAALAARVHAAEQLQRAQAGSLGSVQADVQTLQRALDVLTAPPAKGKGKTETGSVKLK